MDVWLLSDRPLNLVYLCTRYDSMQVVGGMISMDVARAGDIYLPTGQVHGCRYTQAKHIIPFNIS